MLKEKISIKSKHNRNKYIILSVILLIGAIAGAIFGSKSALSDSGSFENFISAYKLHGAASNEIFVRALKTNLRPVFLIWVSGWSLLLIPLNLIQMISKGFGLGYTMAYLISVSGFKGFLFGFLSLFVQNIILLPVFLMLAVYEINFASAFSMKNTPIKQRRRMTIDNLTIFIFAIISAIISSLAEAQIAPIFIRMLSNSII